MHYRIPNREKRDLTPEEVLSDSYGEIALRMEKPVAAQNFFFFATLLAIGVVLVASRVLWLALANYAAYARVAEANRTREIFLPAQRGLIYDRTGQALLHNTPVMDLVTIPGELPGSTPERIREAERLAALFAETGADAADLVLRISSTASKPILVREHLFSREALRFTAHAAEFPGILLRATPSRVYGEGGAFYHLLGVVGRANPQDVEAGYLPSDFLGKSGIEASYEERLRGAYGKDLFAVDARGEVMRLLTHEAAREGEYLVLAIDAGLQQSAFRALSRVVEARHLPGAALVAIDPRDGKILALISVPSVDGNTLGAGLSAEAYQALRNDARHPFFNRAIAARYPTGSTIKPFIGVAALAEHIVTPNTVIQDAGAISVPSVYDPSIVYTFHGYAALGPVDIYSAIARSSDIYFYTVGGGYRAMQGLGIERIDDYLQRFGFGKLSGIDIPGENEGLVPSPAFKGSVKHEPWYIGDTYNISIGQGDIGVTPLQLAVATAAIANGGTLWRPQLALRTVDKDFNTLHTFAPKVAMRDIAPAEYFEIIRKAMRQTVTAGTAKILQQLPVAAAAKTGTAQTGGIHSPFHSLATMFAPYENPEIALAIIVEKAGEGNEVAVPIARDILMEYFSPKEK